MQDVGRLGGVELDEGLLSPGEVGTRELVVDLEGVVVAKAKGSHVQHDLGLHAPHRIQRDDDDDDVLFDDDEEDEDEDAGDDIEDGGDDTDAEGECIRD